MASDYTDFLNELADYLVAVPGIGTVATDVFVGDDPGEPNAMVSLFGLPGNTIGDQRSITALQFPRFQAYIRDPDYGAGAAKLDKVRARLHGLYNVMLPHHRILRCHADQEGGPIGKDEQGRYEFTVNFSAEQHDVAGA